MFDLTLLIKTVGYAGLFGIIFAESGLLFGFFLPGDSLLFTAGVLASQGYLNIYALCFYSFIAAILGDNVGYAFGSKVGHRIFTREDSFFFHKDNLIKAEKFFQKYGGKAIVLARFVPVVRTFTPILAGVGKMNYRTFLIYNFFGATLWALGLTLLGYFLGNTIPNIERYMLPIILLIIISSLIPNFVHLARNHKNIDFKDFYNKILKKNS